MAVDDCPPRELLEAVAAGMTIESGLVSHLESCADCRETLAGLRAANALADDVASNAGGTENARPAVPGFTFLHEIHRGGQGVVWLAEQVATRRRVAVKLLLAGRMATSRQRRRFEREIEVVAGLSHPAIVTVFESGVSSDGQVYCAMEFVEGRPLDGWCRGERPPIPERVSLLARIADAIGEAHRRGVIHRDLKPANILVDDVGDPHVLDFGLARLENERDPERGAMLQTVEGEFLGTFAYAAPEQLTGDPSSVDTRADVYALGLLLFEVITGERPFSTPASIAELVDQRVDRVAPRPSSRVRGVGRELDLIVARALDPEADRRYGTAGELADDLHRLLDGRPVRARGDGLGYLLWKAVQRHTLPVAFAAIVLVLIVGSSIALWQLYRESEVRRRDAEAVEAAIVEAFSFLNPQEGGSMDMRLPDLIERLEIVAMRKLDDQPRVQSRVLRLAGDSFCNLERFEAASRCFERTHDLETSLVGSEDRSASPGLAAAEHDLARVAYHAARERRRAADAADASGRHGDAAALRTEALARLRDAESRYRAALAARRRLAGVDSEDVAMSMQHLATTLVESIRIEAAGPDDPRFAEGEDLLREALGIRLARRPLLAERVATTWNTLAVLRSVRGDEAGTIDAARRAAELVADDDAPEGWAGRAQASLGHRLLEAGRPEEAIEPLGRGLSICRAVYGDDIGFVRRLRLNLVEAMLRADRASEALERIEVFRREDSSLADPVGDGFELELARLDALVALARIDEARSGLDRIAGTTGATDPDRRVERRLELLGGPGSSEADPLNADILDRWGRRGDLAG